MEGPRGGRRAQVQVTEQERTFRSTCNRGQWLGAQPQAEMGGRGFSGQLPRSPAHSPGLAVSGWEAPWRLARPPSCRFSYLLPRTSHSNETGLSLSRSRHGLVAHAWPPAATPSPGPHQPTWQASEAVMPKTPLRNLSERLTPPT